MYLVIDFRDCLHIIIPIIENNRLSLGGKSTPVVEFCWGDKGIKSSDNGRTVHNYSNSHYGATIFMAVISIVAIVAMVAMVIGYHLLLAGLW